MSGLEDLKKILANLIYALTFEGIGVTDENPLLPPRESIHYGIQVEELPLCGDQMSSGQGFRHRSCMIPEGSSSSWEGSLREHSRERFNVHYPFVGQAK
jgi:hypothetical protein